MTKQFYLAMYPGDWKKDAALQRCSLATKGAWIELLFAMHEAGTGELQAPLSELARLVRCTDDEMLAALVELKSTGTAEVRGVEQRGRVTKNVTKRDITISSRRLSRECHARETQREKWRKRQKRHRDTATPPEGNGRVTPESRDGSRDSHLHSSESQSKSESESSSSQHEQLQKPVTSKSLMSTASTAAREVGEHWKQRLNHPSAVLDDKRLKPVVAMLAYYSVDQLKRAVDGCAMSAFHMGANDNLKIYDSLSLICRDTEHVERFIDFTEGNGNAQRQPRSAPLSKNGQRLVDSLAAVARRAADEARGDYSGVAQPARLELLRRG